MSYQNLRKKTEGFTIIEVLIVLAIAGLIMLIVFLAVPALQRNSRNSARSGDASKIAANISQCMANRNGQVAACNTQALLTTNGGLVAAELQQITPLTNVTYSATAPTNGQFNHATFTFGYVCDATGGAATTSGANSRSAVVQFRAEQGGSDGIVRCINV